MYEQSIPPCEIPDAWLIAPPSYVMDRFVPACERINLPAKQVAGGALRYGRGLLPEHEDVRGRLMRLRHPRRARAPAPTGAVFDLRRNVPQNWAHFLNNHLPVVFHLCDRMEIDWADVVLVTPQQTPGYIHGAAALFGMSVLATDDILDGQGVVFDVLPWTGLRPARADWARGERAMGALARLDGADLPQRVFLSRRNTRAVADEGALSAWLAARGFTTIYPEDLSPSDQMRLFRTAEVIVAIHGAGLAPLLYAPAGGPLRQLVEILPCGHMTDVYRVMAHQVGCGWIGVRGRMKPEYVQPSYDFSKTFSQFSLDTFEVDLAALELAFDMAGL